MGLLIQVLGLIICTTACAALMRAGRNDRRCGATSKWATRVQAGMQAAVASQAEGVWETSEAEMDHAGLVVDAVPRRAVGESCHTFAPHEHLVRLAVVEGLTVGSTLARWPLHLQIFRSKTRTSIITRSAYHGSGATSSRRARAESATTLSMFDTVLVS